MQSSLAANPLSDSIALEQSYSFILEDNKGKTISGSNPLEVFYSLVALDDYLMRNPELTEMPEAGIAGYISYEGDCEFGLYEQIVIASGAKQSNSKDWIASSCSTPRNDVIIYPDSKKYIEAVKKCQNYIKEGDIYQANIAHKFEVRGSKPEGLRIYNKLKQLNPSPYMGYMNFKNYQIISSSPECFLSIQTSSLKPQASSQCWNISSSPIKGTASLKELDYLLSSSKEKAEHIMIVDLIRSDLSKICDSVEVSEMLSTHKFKNLYHLISTVKGELRTQGLPKFEDIFAATFPGGSITGAPKIRAMQIIKELEACARGPYTGTMGYFRFRDGGKFNILIRTIVIDKQTNETSFHVGSGITSESDPKQELEETYLKAEKILEVFNGN